MDFYSIAVLSGHSAVTSPAAEGLHSWPHALPAFQCHWLQLSDLQQLKLPANCRVPELSLAEK